jgi:hypothetical protein
MAYCLGVFIISRIGLSVLGLTVGWLTQGVGLRERPAALTATPGIHNLWDGLFRYDAQWFTFIAEKGYDAHPSAAAFFPLYPLTIRVVAWLPGIGAIGAATIVSNLSYFCALVLLYRLTEREFTTDMARRTVVLLACFPTAFFFMAPYSESLFLLLTLLSFAMMRRERWPSGAIAGCGAALTRVIGVVLIPSFLVEAWTADRDNVTRAKRSAWTLVIALGPALYLWWWWVHTGDPLAPFSVQQAWNRTLAFPVTTLGRSLAQAIGGIGQSDGGYWISDFVLTAVVIAGVVTIGRRIAPSYLVYAGLSLLVPLSYPYLGRDLVSVSRFVLVIFPAFWGIAHWCRRRAVYVTWITISTALLVWHAILFMHWRPVV